MTNVPVYQRLHGAMVELSLGPDDVHERLKRAWYDISELRLAFNPRDFDFVLPPWLEEEVRPVFALWDRFDRPTIDNAVASPTTEQCREYARDIWEWYDRIRDDE